MLEETSGTKYPEFERIRDDLARISIPLSFFSVPVNVHVLQAERPVVIDTGPRTPEGRERLAAGLARLAIGERDIADVIVTHHHIDHSGLLADLVEQGAQAWAHEDEAENVLSVTAWFERRGATYRALMGSWGFPDALRDAVEHHNQRYRDMAGTTRRDRFRPIAGESAALPIAGARLRAIHVPGHTEGQIVLHEEGRNLLFSADHVLERVTPNPGIYVPLYRGKLTGLGDYLGSLERLRSVPRDVLVCPGHGAPFRGLHARLDEILEHHGERRDAILAALAKGERSVLDLAGAIWPRLEPAHVALACREVHGHLDLLVASGEVTKRDEPVWKFTRS